MNSEKFGFIYQPLKGHDETLIVDVLWRVVLSGRRVQTAWS